MILLCSQDGELLSHSKKVKRTSRDGLQQWGIVLMTEPSGRVQAVGEGLGVFMHDRAINGCWDIPNLYG